MNADGGIGTAASSTAARSSLPASKDYPCPRLRQTSPPHCTSMHSQLPIPRWALPSVLFALHAKAHEPTVVPHTHEIGHSYKSTSARTGNNAQTHTHSHKCTLARRARGALTCETVGAATPWRREQRISATRASKRRPSTRYETVGAATPWRREQRTSATKASKRRPSTRCKRKAKLRLDVAALRRLVRVA